MPLHIPLCSIGVTWLENAAEHILFEAPMSVRTIAAQNSPGTVLVVSEFRYLPNETPVSTRAVSTEACWTIDLSQVGLAGSSPELEL